MDWVSLWRNGGMLMAGQAVDSGQCTAQCCRMSPSVCLLVLQFLTETLKPAVVFVFLLSPPRQIKTKNVTPSDSNKPTE